MFSVEVVRGCDSVPRHQHLPDVLVDEAVGVVVLRVHVDRPRGWSAPGREPPGSSDVLLPSPVPDLVSSYHENV